MYFFRSAAVAICFGAVWGGGVHAGGSPPPGSRPAAEIRFGTIPLPGRRRISLELKANLISVIRPENGEETTRPLLEVTMVEIRREELDAAEPLSLRVHYDKHQWIHTLAGQPAKPDSYNVEGRTYRVTFAAGSSVPNANPKASAREGKRLREDYARELLVRRALLRTQGTTALIGERAESVEGILRAFSQSNPGKAEEDTRIIALEARAIGRENFEDHEAVRFAVVLRLAIRLGPAAEMFVESRGHLVLRISDAALLLLETEDELSSTKALKDGYERYMVGHGTAKTRFAYGVSVSPLPSLEEPSVTGTFLDLDCAPWLCSRETQPI